MSILDFIIIIIAYLLAVFILSIIGGKREIGSAKAFIISLFLTPVVGIIYVSHSPRNGIVYFERYYCERCGLEFTEKSTYCPVCEKEGYKIKLKKILRKGV